MRTTVAESTIEVVADGIAETTEPAPSTDRSSSETEADRIRRQLHLRRKTKLARRALMARRAR